MNPASHGAEEAALLIVPENCAECSAIKARSASRPSRQAAENSLAFSTIALRVPIVKIRKNVPPGAKEVPLKEI